MEGSDRGGMALTPAHWKEDPDDARSHAVKLETTEFQVKEEAECESRTDCAAEASGLYAGHVVKDELVVGPESVEVRERNDDRSRGQMRGEIEISNPELNIVPGNNTFTGFLHHTAKTNTYTCETCGKTFLHKHDVMDHMKTHLRENTGINRESLTKESNLSICKPTDKVSCKICNKKVAKRYLKYHERSHTGDKPYSCEICKKEFAVMSILKAHKLVHTGERPYSCDLCKKSFFKSSHLTIHKRTHTGEKPYTCGVCKMGFTNMESLKTHIRIHTGEKPYECPFCGKRYRQWYAWHHHKRLHTGKMRRDIEISSPNLNTVPGSDTSTNFLHHTAKTNTYTCDTCGKTFLHKHDIIDHVKTHQENSGKNLESLTKKSNLSIRKPADKVSCKICNKKVRKRYLKYHERSHTGDKPYSCEICKRDFAVASILKAHKLVHTGERPYSCDVCKKSFNKKFHLILHKRSHTGEKPYTCEVCKKGFTQMINLKTHIRVHTGERPYQCPFCEKRYCQQSGLENHKRLHTGEKLYACEICEQRFTNSRALNSHKFIHTNEKKHISFSNDEFEKHIHKHKVVSLKEKPECESSADLSRVSETGASTSLCAVSVNDKPECGSRADACGVSETDADVAVMVKLVPMSVDTHQPHIATILPGQMRREVEISSPKLNIVPGSDTFTDSYHHTAKTNTYICDSCGQTFLHKRDIINHMKTHLRKNSGKNLESLTIESNLLSMIDNKFDYDKVSCKICNKKIRARHLKLHERTHTGEKPYTCGVCKMGFAQKNNLKAHIRTHTGERPYACPFCDKRFCQQTALEIHKRRHTGDKPYSCEICGKDFTIMYSLKKHKLVHTGERPYSCDVCKKSFTRQSHLILHKRTHTGEKPYTCGVCKKGFTQIIYLNTHIRIHTGERPYACPFCEKRYCQKSGLERHKRLHTGEKLYACVICEKKFAHPDALNSHKIIHTNEKRHIPFSNDNFENHINRHKVVSLKEMPECENSADLSRVSETGASTNPCAYKADACGVSETDADVVVKIELVPWSEDAQQPDIATILPEQTHQEIEVSSPGLNIAPESNIFTDFLQHTEETNIFACDTCAKTFQYKHDIIDHVKTHMGENSGKNLESLTIESNLSIRELPDKVSCEICNKEFTKNYLRIHKRIHSGEKPYTCGVCKKGFPRAEPLKTHMRIHTGEGPYECPFCEKRYTQWYALEYHKRLHAGEQPSSSTSFSALSESYPSNGEKQYACEICNKNFNELSNFEKHKQEHAVVNLKEDPEYESSADACGVSGTGTDVVVKVEPVPRSEDIQQPDTVTIIPGQMRREIEVPGSDTFTDFLHDTAKTNTNTYTCNTCGQTFLHQHDIIDHIKTHLQENSGKNLESLTIEPNLSIREPTGKVSCEICNKKFRKKYLKIHKRTHTGEKPYTCGVCKKRFARVEPLKAHMRFHTGELPYECLFCGKRYRQWSSLDYHKRSHIGEQPSSLTSLSALSESYPRDGEQPSSSTSFSALSESYPRDGEKPSSSTSFSALSESYPRDGEKPSLSALSESYPRDGEQPSSSTLFSALSQSYLRDGAIPYACEICEMTFTHSGALKSHKIMHTKEKNHIPFSCEICNMNFNELSIFERHKQEHAVVYLKEDSEYESSADACGVSETGTDVVIKVELVPRSEDIQQPDTVTIIPGQMRREIEVPGSDTFTDFLHDTAKTNTNTYTCNTCGQTFLHQHDIIDHIKTHLQENSAKNLESFTNESKLFIRKPIEKFPCKICNKKFRKNYLKIHERFHTGAKPYSCEVCKKEFAVLENLKLHKRVHTEERPYSCDVCKKSFSSSTHLKVHKRTHTGEKPYVCEVCKKGFALKINLKTHIRVHTGERPYECPFCEKRYSQQSGLEQHKRLHTGEAPYACEICEKRFTHPSALNRHKLIHTTDKKHKPFSCQICNKNYKRLGDFENHKHNKHEVVKSYTCDTCGKTFLHKHDIIDHITTHMPDNSKNLESLIIESNLSISELNDKVSCEICNKTFRKKYLKIHKRMHTGEKPYTCGVCKRGFARLESLKSHTRTHTGETPYECPVCGKRYRQPSGLEYHKRMHTGEKPSSTLSQSNPRDGEKPYACEICEMKFTHSGALKRHKIMHKDKKYKPFSCQICYKDYKRLSDFEKHTHMHEVVSLMAKPECESSADLSRVSETGASTSLCAVSVNDKPECGSSAVVCGVSETGADLGVKADLVPTSEGTQQTDIATSLPATSALLNYEAQTHTPSREQECISHEPDTETQATVALKQITTKKRPYTCDICHKAFTQSGSLATHKRIHTGEKPYTCEVCNKKFTALGTLNNHKKSVHLNIKAVRVACKICNKNIAKCSLKNHERIHSDVKLKPYACEVCKKAFFTKGDLKAHQQVHSEERPRYTCDVCQKRFLRLSTLATHVRKHT